MKLQFAMDTLSTDAALELAAAAAPHVDILELGTPLIKSAGLSAITAVKEAHPDKTVFADLKTMDAGELEADDLEDGLARDRRGAGARGEDVLDRAPRHQFDAVGGRGVGHREARERALTASASLL